MKPVALVTGASSGIGLATALRLLDEGYAVYGGARRTENMAALEARGGVALFLDLLDDDAMMAAVTRILDSEDRIDVLVNNAGFGLLGPLEEVPIAEARRQLDVNVLGQVRMIQLVLPAMRARGAGHIINMSSVAGQSYLPIAGWYHASKHALEVLSDTLRMEVEPFGIHVTVIEPGAVKTEWLDVARGDTLSADDASPYAPMTRTIARVFRDAFGDSFAIEPGVVADTVVRALRARRPKTRYLVGKMVRLPLFMKRFLTDRAFQRSIGWHLKRMGLGDPAD